MLRTSLISAMACIALMSVPDADAQRQQAEIVQGVTSGELAATVDELRASNAEMRARMTGIESDKARLNGKLETLEFLLSESRDEINRMQSDDAELERLITRLEGRISDQEKTIADLNSRLTALQPEPAFLSAGSGDSLSDPIEASDNPATDSVAQQLDAAVESGGDLAASGPTRIVRRVEAPAGDGAGAVPTQLGPDGQPLPQGSLGTLPASALLPEEAGPLFAEAKSRLLQFDYPGAELAFRSFLTQFNEDPQAGEAQYWLAEVLYQQESYPESGAAYTDMIRSYPDDPRAPEALAKLARSMRLVGDTEQACNALNLLPQRYPNASGVTRNLAAGERVRSGCDS
ncbi:MAG: tol-pal system protein YbgF [Pseudomonadota bacterium]